jgi:myosin heavy subunit
MGCILLTYKAEIREMLRNNVPVKEIREKFRSRSMLYECLTDYLLELADKVEETRNASRQEQTKLQETRTKREQLTSETESLQNDVKSLNSKKESLTGEVESLHKVHETLKKNVRKFRERGFTPEIMNELREARDIDGPELHDLLQRRESRNTLRMEVDTLQEKEANLTKKIKVLTEETHRLDKKLVSEENKLDLLEAQEAVFQDVANILKTAIKDGYSPQQLKALLLMLRKLEIQGTPALSISHLLQCLAEAKSLLNLKHEAGLAKKRLDEFLTAESEAKARVEIVQNTVLLGIERWREQGEEAIAGVEAQATNEVKRVASQSTDAIETLSDAFSEAMNRAVSELGRVKEETGRLEHLVEPARLLTGIIQYPKCLKPVSPLLVEILLRNLALWCQQRIPKCDVGAIYNTVANEFQLNNAAVPRYRISALVRLAAEVITRLISQRQSEDHKGRGEWHA